MGYFDFNSPKGPVRFKIAGLTPTQEEQARIRSILTEQGLLGEPPAPDSGGIGEFLGEGVENIGRGFLRGLTEVPRGLASFGFATGISDLDPSKGEGALTRASDAASGWVDEFLPRDPDAGWTADLGEGIGSMLSFLTPAGLAGAGAKALGAGTKAAQYLGLGAAGAQGTFLGGGEQAQRIQAQRLAGEEIDEETSRWSQLFGLGIGSTEVLPLQRLLKPLGKLLRYVPADQGQKAIDTIGKRLRRAIGIGVAEGSQELFASIAQDLVQQGMYDPDLEIGESAWTEFSVGGTAGGGLQFILDSFANRRGKRLLQEQEATQRAENEARIAAEREAQAQKEAAARKGLPAPEKRLALPAPETAYVEETGVAQSKPLSFEYGPDGLVRTSQDAKDIMDRYANILNTDVGEGPFFVRSVGDSFQLVNARGQRLGNTTRDTEVLQRQAAELNAAWQVRQRDASNQNIRQRDAELTAQAAREATLPIGSIELGDLNADIAGAIRVSRQREGAAEIDAPVTVEEITERLGEDIAKEVVAEIKPLTRGTGAVTEATVVDQRQPDTFEAEYRKAVERVRQDGAVSPEAIKESAEVDEARAEEILDAMARRGVIVQMKPGTYRLSENIGPVRNVLPADLPPGNSEFNIEEVKARGGQPAFGLVERRYGDDFDLLGKAVHQTFPTRKEAEAALAQRKAPSDNIYATEPGQTLVREGSPTKARIDRETFQQKWKPLARVLGQTMKGFGLDNVRGGIIDKIRTLEGKVVTGPRAGAVEEDAKAVYDPDLNAIFVAADKLEGLSKEDAARQIASLLRHETIHALRNMGVFTPEEWGTLTKYARTAKRRDGRTYQQAAEEIYAGTYSQLNPSERADVITEEAVADAFQDFADDPKSIYSPRVRGLFNRIVEFFRRLLNAMRNTGVTYADIFQSIERGERRGSNEPRPGGARFALDGEIIPPGGKRRPGPLWYSNLERMVQSIEKDYAFGNTWKTLIRKHPWVQSGRIDPNNLAEEMRELKLAEFLDSKTKQKKDAGASDLNISKSELLDYIDAASKPFETRETVLGGRLDFTNERVKELLDAKDYPAVHDGLVAGLREAQVPNSDGIAQNLLSSWIDARQRDDQIDERTALADIMEVINGPREAAEWHSMTLGPLNKNYTELLIGINPETGKFTGGHWRDDLNVMMHIRFDERMTPNNDLVLFINEMQSDWHRDGSRTGYTSGDAFAERKKYALDVIGAHARKIEEEFIGLERKLETPEMDFAINYRIPTEDYRRYRGAPNFVAMSILESIGAAARMVKQATRNYDNRIPYIKNASTDAEFREGIAELEADLADILNGVRSIKFNSERAIKVIEDFITIADKELLTNLLNQGMFWYDPPMEVATLATALQGVDRVALSRPTDIPWKNTWHRYGVKRMLRMAAEQGADFLAWPATGEQVGKIEGWGRNWGDEAYQGIIKRITDGTTKEVNKLVKGFGAQVERIEVGVDQTDAQPHKLNMEYSEYEKIVNAAEQYWQKLKQDDSLKNDFNRAGILAMMIRMIEDEGVRYGRTPENSIAQIAHLLPDSPYRSTYDDYTKEEWDYMLHHGAASSLDDIPYSWGRPAKLITQTVNAIRLTSEMKAVFVRDGFARFKKGEGPVVNPQPSPANVEKVQLNIVYGRVADLVGNTFRKLGAGDIKVAKVQRAADSFLTKLQDKMLPVGRMVDATKELGGKVEDGMDPYMAEELFSGRVQTRIKDNTKSIYKPFLVAARDLGFDSADVKSAGDVNGVASAILRGYDDPNKGIMELYLYARHAPERNKRMRDIGSDKSSGMTDHEASQIMRWFQSNPRHQKVVEAAALFDKITASTRSVRVDGDLTPDFDEMLANGDTTIPDYKHYAPLRGHLEEDITDLSADEQLRGGAGFKIRGKEDLSATGRESLGRDLIEHAILQNQEAIIRAEKNMVGQSFLNLVEANKDTLQSFAEIVEEVPMRRALVNGEFRFVPDPNYKNQSEYLVVKRKGKEVAIRVKDPRIARAMNGNTGLGPEAMSLLSNSFGVVTNFIARLATTYNPEFMLSNFMKDIQTALVNVSANELRAIGRDVRRNLKGAFGGVRAVIRKDDPSSEFARAFREFQEEGGVTGHLGLRSLQDTIKKVNRELKKDLSGPKGKSQRAFKHLYNFIEDYNTIVENTTRTAVYKALRDRGVSKKRAAQAAKNVTVNFNKRGEYGAAMNQLYMFFNASLQGSMAMMSAAARSSKVRKIIGGIMLAGVIQDMVMSALSPEDEDGELLYDKIPEWRLQHNLIFLDPLGISERGYFSIPMPYGYNAIHNMGRSISKAVRGKADAGETIASGLGTLVNAFNPVGGTNSFLNFVSPTALDPLIDLWGTNEDFTGKPIYPEASPFGIAAPKSSLYWNNTSPLFVDIAQWLSKVSGGTPVIPGAVEISPGQMQYAVEYFLGGLGAFLRRTYDFSTGTLFDLVQGDVENISIGEIPFARKFYANMTDREDVGAFSERRNEILTIGKELDEARKYGEADRVRAVREKYRKELAIYPRVKRLNTRRNSILAKIREIERDPRIPQADKDERISRLQEQAYRIVHEVNRLYQQEVLEG